MKKKKPKIEKDTCYFDSLMRRITNQLMKHRGRRHIQDVLAYWVRYLEETPERAIEFNQYLVRTKNPAMCKSSLDQRLWFALKHVNGMDDA